MRPSLFWSPILATLLLTSAAFADWPAGGKRLGLADDGFNGTYGVRFLDLPSGDLAVVMFGVGGGSLGYSVQRISPTGDVGPGWPGDGIILGECSGSVLPIYHGFVVDDSGCVWHGGYMNQSAGMYSQLIRPDAGLLPGTFASWQTFTFGGPMPVDAAPAPGGAYIVASGRIQRMTRFGLPASGWATNGIGALSTLYDIAAIADGAGGALVFSSSSTVPSAQRIDGDAVRHAGWPAAGMPLSNAAEDQLADFDPKMGEPLITSGPSAFIAAWTTPWNSYFKKVKLQRFLLDGSLDPMWPPGGLVAVATDSISGVTLIPDGQNGAHLLWYSLTSNTIRGTHVLANGQFAGGLGPQGVTLPSPGSQPHITTRGAFVPGLPLDFVPADAAPNGGLVFAWNDDALPPGNNIRVRWLRADYSADPNEPLSGRLLPVSAPLRGVHSDGLGGAFVAWDVLPADAPPFPEPSHEIWMTRLLPSSLVGVPAMAHGSSLALSSPRPNPSRGAIAFDLMLPDDSPARIELLDIAGRVQRTQLVQGPGAHAVTFGDAASLAPGLYFARLKTRAGERSVRVALAR
jgi:hypothetical protein